MVTVAVKSIAYALARKRLARSGIIELFPDPKPQK